MQRILVCGGDPAQNIRRQNNSGIFAYVANNGKAFNQNVLRGCVEVARTNQKLIRFQIFAIRSLVFCDHVPHTVLDQ